MGGWRPVSSTRRPRPWRGQRASGLAGPRSEAPGGQYSVTPLVGARPGTGVSVGAGDDQAAAGVCLWPAPCARAMTSTRLWAAKTVICSENTLCTLNPTYVPDYNKFYF